MGEFLNKPGRKLLYVQNETKVRLVHGYEVIDLDTAPYRLEPGNRERATATATHDFGQYRADMMLLNMDNYYDDDVDDKSTGAEEEEEVEANGGGGVDGHRRRAILVSTHDDTREFLCREGWRYWLVYPAKDPRAAWVQRLRDRDAGNPDRAKIDRFVKALDERFEGFVEGVVAGLPVENQGVGGGGRRRSSSAVGGSRPSWIAAGGRVQQASSSGGSSGGNGGGGVDDDNDEGRSGSFPSPSSSNVQWLEIQDAKMGLTDIVPFLIAQQERLA